MALKTWNNLSCQSGMSIGKYDYVLEVWRDGISAPWEWSVKRVENGVAQHWTVETGQEDLDDELGEHTAKMHARRCARKDAKDRQPLVRTIQ